MFLTKSYDKIDIIPFYDDSRLSITTDAGDILDLDYFAKRVCVKKKKLLKIFSKNGVNYSIYKGVLCFDNIEEAVNAILLIEEKNI